MLVRSAIFLFLPLRVSQGQCLNSMSSYLIRCPSVVCTLNYYFYCPSSCCLDQAPLDFPLYSNQKHVPFPCQYQLLRHAHLSDPSFTPSIHTNAPAPVNVSTPSNALQSYTTYPLNPGSTDKIQEIIKTTIASEHVTLVRSRRPPEFGGVLF